MRVLVLGGTAFVGRAIVENLLARGDQVTLFSRGVTGADLFPELPRRRGDRTTGDYGSLGDGAWDAVVDVSAYIPRHVTQAADVLGDRIGRYLFISTGSVYDRAGARPGMTEDSLRLPPERGTEEVTETTYGPLKVACEDDAVARYGDRATIVRPGVVGGPYDNTDRFTWWVRRVARGGRMAVAARLEQPLQVVDSRDLAALVTALLHADRPGTFNAVGPADPTTIGGMIAACATAAGTTVDPVVLESSTVDPPFPLVFTDPAYDPLFCRSAAAARSAGMTATPLTTTAADVLAWDRARGEPPLLVGVTADQEAALLG